MTGPAATAIGTAGRVDLVGAGPGDPELITLKAVRLLEQAEVVVYDRLVNPVLLQHCRSDCARIYVGKRKHCHSMPQARICELLVLLGRQGKRVVRLKGGDPFIFGRGGEEIDALNAAGIPCALVPGITAATGCAAATGIPLTHRDHAQAVTFVTAHRAGWQARARLGAAVPTQPHHRGLHGAVLPRRNCGGADQHGLPSATPVAVIANGTTAHQQEIIGTLADIAWRVEKKPLPSPALLIVGDVVAARGQLTLPGSESARALEMSSAVSNAAPVRPLSSRVG